MSSEKHSSFTLLHEDGDTRILYEFKSIVADDVLHRIVDFLKGVGYMESSIFETMQEISDEYFNSLEPMTLPVQQDDLKVD